VEKDFCFVFRTDKPESSFLDKPLYLSFQVFTSFN
jgi:hypothetical protein